MGSCFSSLSGGDDDYDKARLNPPPRSRSSGSAPPSLPASNLGFSETPNPPRKVGGAGAVGAISSNNQNDGKSNYSSNTNNINNSSNNNSNNNNNNHLFRVGPAPLSAMKQAGGHVLPVGPGAAGTGRGGGGKVHLLGLPETNLRSFTYQELKAATRGFNKDFFVGEGGFGNVYQGWIDETMQAGGGTVVAVKVLNTEGLQGHKEWKAEVNFLGLLHHPNLVHLIGYCAEEEQRLLVYEYMPRGSLELHLFRRSAPVMPWSVRMKVALGAARGLAYLHEEAERQVIYRDFKTSNILLDENFEAKLSDFGLAKDGPEGDKTHVSTRVMGTYGYAAPEYVMTGHLTAKSDVYSYGVVLLELITGRRSMDKYRPPEEHNLVEWARPFLADKRKLFHLMDPRLEGHYSVRAAQKAATLAQHCLYRDPKARPLMSDVVETLKPLQDLTDIAAAAPAESNAPVSVSGGGGRLPAALASGGNGPDPQQHRPRPRPLPLPQSPAHVRPTAVAPVSPTLGHRPQGGAGGLQSRQAASRSAAVKRHGRTGF